MQLTSEMLASAEKLLDYVNSSPTAAHAVDTGCALLKKHNFKHFTENSPWHIDAGTKFQLKLHDTALVSGIEGKGDLVQNGFRIIGAHTDSPGFRIRHNGFFKKNAYSQAGIEIYGGPLLSSWSDKDLGIAGRILIKKANGSPKSGQSRENSFESLLWKSDKALLRIPQLAIHLNREVNDKGLKFNKENELTPILCSMQDVDLNEEELLNYIAQDLGIFRKDIHSYSLELFDMQKAALGGMHDDMIFAGRIDNLAMCIAGLNMLTELDEEPDSTLLLMLFDSEEIGSSTINGGASPLLMRTMERLMFKAGLNTEEQAICLSNSRIFSADGAHAVHPNFTSKHPEKHPVYMNAGPVIKVNANQRYASNLQTIAETEELAKMAGVPVQKYYHRNDIPCGSTIGPISATGTGIPTVDIGNAMLSMHSIRECTGTADQWYMEELMKKFLTV